MVKSGLEKHKVLVVLLTSDIAFILLHILYVYTGLLPSSLYSLARDRGYAEFFQYTKQLWVVILLLLLGIKQRRGLYGVFSLLFLYFLVDDYGEIHENLGRLLAEVLRFGPRLGLRAVDFGELLVSAVFGLLFAMAIALVYLLSDRTTRRVALHLIALVAVLAGFGVGLDMVEIIVDHAGISRLLVILEEGGELLVMSVIVWFVMHLDLDGERPPMDWLPMGGGGTRAEGQDPRPARHVSGAATSCKQRSIE